MHIYLDNGHQNMMHSVCLFVDRLMRYSLPLASRGIHHELTGELLASLSRDEHGAGTANIHAGSALLASGGVCLLGDLTCYKKDKMDMLQSGANQFFYIISIADDDTHKAYALKQT